MKRSSGRKRSDPKPKKDIRLVCKSIGRGSFLSSGARPTTKPGGITQTGLHVTQLDSHSIVEELTTGGIVNWTAFDQPTTKPKERVRAKAST